MDRSDSSCLFGALIMSTQEAVIAVLAAAIFANLVLAVGLVVGPRVRSRREAAHNVALHEAAGTGPGLESGVGIPRALGGRPVPGGLGTPNAPLGPRLAHGSEERARAMDAHLRGGAGAASAAGAAGAADPIEPLAADPVTGFDLAPTWTKWLAEEGARVDRYGRPATIVIVELTDLDRLAEKLGPEAADRLIPPIATTMRRHARAADNLARLGRARFGALLTETDEIRAINYIERVRTSCDVWLESGAVALRLSIGWAEIGANQPVEVAIQTAERRLNEERQRRRARADPDADAEPDVQAAMQAQAAQA